MASIIKEPKGRKTIQFTASDGRTRPKIRLGKVDSRTARSIKIKIEALVQATITGFAPDDETSRWVAELDITMAEKLCRVGLLPKREYATVKDFITGYIDSRKDIEPETRRAWRQVRDRLVKQFGAACSLKAIGKEDAADWRQDLVNRASVGTKLRYFDK